MAFSKKTWVDRWVQFPGRKKETLVSGTTDTYDYERQEGTVFAEGDLRNAANMNDMEDRIETEFTNTHDMYGGTVLWTNPSPTSSFAGQTVSLVGSLSNYESYEVVYAFQNTANSPVFRTCKIPVGRDTELLYSAGANFYRYVNTSGNTSVSFSDCQTFPLGGGASSVVNVRMIPLNVIGYK